MKFVKTGVSHRGIMTVTLLYFGCMHVCVNIYGSINMTVKSSIYIAMANYMKLYKCYTFVRYWNCSGLKNFEKNENAKNDNSCKLAFAER